MHLGIFLRWLENSFKSDMRYVGTSSFFSTLSKIKMSKYICVRECVTYHVDIKDRYIVQATLQQLKLL